jgi:hypothetical protein
MKRLLKTAIKKTVKPFLPKYEVVCTNYQLIPGFPVNKNLSRHPFERGASQEAVDFYTKVVSSEFTKKMAPVEVQLKKRGKIVQQMEFGPVGQFKTEKRRTVFSLNLW